jgi:hypothetical protein
MENEHPVDIKDPFGALRKGDHAIVKPAATQAATPATSAASPALAPAAPAKH